LGSETPGGHMENPLTRSLRLIMARTEIPNEPITRYMDERGMLPADWTCLRCGRQLNADGNHPAELYAGTFTGLCYPCTSTGPYVEAVAELDGCRKISYPPNCPSHRRDRQVHHAYPDCPNCHGRGVTTAYAWCNRAHQYCETCVRRFDAHPLRTWRRSRYTTIRDAAQARFEARLDQAAGTRKRASMKVRRAARLALPEDVRLVIQLEVLGDYNRVRDRHESYVDALKVDAWRVPTEDEAIVPEWTPPSNA